MEKEIENECLVLINKYHSYKSNHWKIKKRNELYLLMEKDLLLWITTIISRWGKFERKEDLISISWDVFEYCLKHYKTGNSIISHFWNYTRYALLKHYAEKGSVRIESNELKDVLSVVDDPLNNGFERLLTFIQFYEILPDKYKFIWTDASQSLSNNKKQQQRTRGNTGVQKSTYDALKKIFISQIKFIMK